MLDDRIVVLNFAASILTNARLRAAAVERIAAALERGQSPLAVCSPIGTPAGGEIVWTGRFLDVLAAGGIRAVSVTRQQIGAAPGADASQIDTSLARELLSQGIVPVVTGALPHGSMSSGGARGGSDVVAVLLGAALGADSVIIYTDAEGVMTADPQRVAGAAPVRYTTYVELMELAERGAAGVTAAAAQIARETATPYQIRSLTSDRGTIVRNDGHVDASRPVTAVTSAADVALVSVRIPNITPARPQSRLENLLARIADHDVPLEMLNFIPGGARFVCERGALPAVREELSKSDLRHKVLENCAKLCVVGVGIRSTSGIISRLLKCLSNAFIDVLHFADSNVTISLIVALADIERAERAVHDEFLLQTSRATASPIYFDAATGHVHVRGVNHRLGTRQARLLKVLVDNAGRVIAPEEAAQAVFGAGGKEELSALRVHVHNLRKKIEADPDNPRYLLTVPNEGYLFAR